MTRKSADYAIPLSGKRTDLFTPPSLEGMPKELAFQVRVPTPSERDTIGTRLFELGLSPVTDETIRAHIIDELWKIDWASDDAEGFKLQGDERTAFNEAKAEADAQFLDGYWQRQQLDDQIQADWAEKETQRILDEVEGAPKRDPLPIPPKVITIREHSQARILIDDITERSVRIRTLAGKKRDYNLRSNEMMIRLQVLSMSPKDPAAFAAAVKEAGYEVTLDRADDGLLTVDTIDRLREFIGNEAWNELCVRVDGSFKLTETERKNSESPRGTSSDQTGSHEPSGDSASKDGGSTRSSTGPVQADE